MSEFISQEAFEMFAISIRSQQIYAYIMLENRYLFFYFFGQPLIVAIQKSYIISCGSFQTLVSCFRHPSIRLINKCNAHLRVFKYIFFYGFFWAIFGTIVYHQYLIRALISLIFNRVQSLHNRLWGIIHRYYNRYFQLGIFYHIP